MKMTNRIFWHSVVTLLLLCTTGFFTSSCSDSDEAKVDDRVRTEGGKTYVPDSLLTDQERYQLACQSAVMSVMHSLAAVETVTPDVVNQRLEPTYGQSLEGESSTVRAAKCSGTADAEQLFRAIAGLDSIDAQLLYTPTPDGYILSLKDLPILPDGKRFSLGTLTFHRDSGPRCYGYVEVDIPCIPHLERIEYISADAFPDNANAPYQIGDVIYLESGNNLCSGYYVCVENNGYKVTLVHMRHGVNPGGDEGINADGDNEGCWRPYNNDHGHPATYDDVKNYVSFMVDHQAKVANIKSFLNGEAYNMKPSHDGLLRHIFPENFNNTEGVAYTGSTAYVHYNAYITDEYAWVPAYNYRLAEYATVPSGCNNRDDVHCYSKKYVKDSEWSSWVGSHEFTINVIHTEVAIQGARLEYSALNDLLEMGIRADKATTEQLGWCFADDGLLYESPKKASAYGHVPLGVLVYVNDHSQFGNLVTEAEHGYGHGLVIAYTNTDTGNCQYNPQDAPLVSLDDGMGFSKFVTNTEAALTDGNGSEKTAYLANHGSPAAQQAQAYNKESAGTGWMLPSAAQWLAMLCGPNSLGKAKMPNASDGFPVNITFDGVHPFTIINRYIEMASISLPLSTQPDFHYWTSSAYDAKNGVYVVGDAATLNKYSWGKYSFVRPAFAY